MRILLITAMTAAILTGADLRRAPRPVDGASTDERITRLQENVKAQPEAPGPRVALASAFVQKLRETGDGAYLRRAAEIIAGVLKEHPSDRPAARVELEIETHLHEFRKVAEQSETLLSKYPSDAAVLGLRGDALMELGRYEEAGATYRQMAALGGTMASYNRLAWYEFVNGHAETALAWMAQAVAAGSEAAENTAWCLAEFGDMLLKTGRVMDAAQAYQMSLARFPGYHRAHAGMARLLAGKGDWKGAIDHAQRAANVVPLPEYVGMLAAFYQRTGSKSEAARERALLEVLDRLGAANGEKANRTLAVIYADLGENLERAYELAKAEFDVRDDVYSHDAMAWVLFKMGRIDHARQESERAIARGTPEPGFYAHAMEIALAASDGKRAAEMKRILEGLNPAFDVVRGSTPETNHRRDSQDR